MIGYNKNERLESQFMILSIFFQYPPSSILFACIKDVSDMNKIIRKKGLKERNKKLLFGMRNPPELKFRYKIIY